jgi:hypothetical protein
MTRYFEATIKELDGELHGKQTAMVMMGRELLEANSQVH